MESLASGDFMVLLVVLIGAGVLGGLVAGLFGVGGGTVMVPALFHVFEILGLGGERSLHTAVGSSLAVIVFTSMRSLREHRAHGAVDEDILRTWTPWVALGGALGALTAAFVSSGALGLVYALIATGVAAQLGLMPRHWTLSREMPAGAPRAALGTSVGLFSALMGIGGGSLGGMVMTLCGRSIHTAVATASGFGLAIGLPSALGFLIAGWGAEGRPPLSLGYVNVPAVLVMGVLTVLVAPYGARLAHRLDQATLRRCFAVFFLVTAVSVGLKALS